MRTLTKLLHLPRKIGTHIVTWITSLADGDYLQDGSQLQD